MTIGRIGPVSRGHIGLLNVPLSLHSKGCRCKKSLPCGDQFYTSIAWIGLMTILRFREHE